jgi:hypothetical protein
MARPGGATWSGAVKISDATSGAGYKTAAGFAEVYGDYSELASQQCREGDRDLGRGLQLDRSRRVWFNREQ